MGIFNYKKTTVDPTFTVHNTPLQWMYSVYRKKY